MPNRHSNVINPFISITGIVGTHLGSEATCIPLTLIHLIDENGDGYSEVITDGVNIMDYTDYSFLTFNTALDDLSEYTIQPQVSLDENYYFDSTPVFTYKDLEIGSEVEQSVKPNDFGNYSRLKIIAVAKSNPTLTTNDSSRLANTYVFFHGRLH